MRWFKQKDYRDMSIDELENVSLRLKAEMEVLHDKRHEIAQLRKRAIAMRALERAEDGVVVTPDPALLEAN